MTRALLVAAVKRTLRQALRDDAKCHVDRLALAVSVSHCGEDSVRPRGTRRLFRRSHISIVARPGTGTPSARCSRVLDIDVDLAPNEGSAQVLLALKGEGRVDFASSRVADTRRTQRAQRDAPLFRRNAGGAARVRQHHQRVARQDLDDLAVE